MSDQLSDHPKFLLKGSNQMRKPKDEQALKQMLKQTMASESMQGVRPMVSGHFLVGGTNSETDLQATHGLRLCMASHKR